MPAITLATKLVGAVKMPVELALGAVGMRTLEVSSLA